MEVHLRALREEDAVFMLEWMHDKEVQKAFKKDMINTTLEDAQAFCRNAIIPAELEDGTSLHFAIASAEDEYLGTLSLKEIDLENGTAEYAITTRKNARGKGIAFKATGLLLEKAFNEYHLHRVYLSVYADNAHAIRLYEKCGFKFEGEFRGHIKRGNVYMNWKWYGMLNSEYDRKIFEK